MVTLAIEVVIITHVFISKARCFAPILIKIVIHKRIVLKIPTIHIYAYPSGVKRVIPCAKTDRRTDMIDMTKQTVAFRNCFANAPKNWQIYGTTSQFNKSVTKYTDRCQQNVSNVSYS
jgi:hypothetical protein